MYENENVIQSNASVSDYVTKVFVWMFIGLIVTALVAYGIVASGLIFRILFMFEGLSWLVLSIAELGLVVFLSSKVAKNTISPTGARVGFIVYAIINGITLSTIFLVYQVGLIYQAFIVSALTFGAMALVGHVTKKDLTGIGSFLIMGLVGVILATLVNAIFSFFGFFSGSLDLILSYITVFIFLGLTAYDVQKLKAYYYASSSDENMSNNFAIMGALSLYLDFINIFLHVLKIFARNSRN